MPKTDLQQVDTKKNIVIKGAKMHNLKGVDVIIPRNKFIVITGLSGSGKSSLAFDTLYAEGQRRYVESLSSYARQFMGKLDKPEVEYIKGISPAIAIEQKVNTRNPRSTVGTTTEIYDYLKLLFARIGRTFSPVSGEEVKRDTVTDVVNYITSLTEGSKLMIASPLLVTGNKTLEEQVKILKQQGFTRLLSDEKPVRIEDFDPELHSQNLEILIDRVVANDDEDNQMRIADSVQTAFYEGDGSCSVLTKTDNGFDRKDFSNRFELDGITFEQPTHHFFAFNNPLGACKTCEGFGSVMGIDPDLVIPNKGLSVYEEAIVCWKGEKMSKWKDKLIRNAAKFDFPIHRPIHELTEEQKELLWTGNEYFKGLNAFFKHLESKSYKIQFRVMLSRYRGKTTCPDCKGTRLRKDASYVKINDKSIIDLVLTPVDELYEWFQGLNNHLTDYDKKVGKRLLIEINNRLQFLQEVGLSYLTLNRTSGSLSGGESQRINLATTLGSSLVGSMYILDEPSIGLHPRDTNRLVGVLHSLKRLGNTVIVVEHEEEVMRAADEIIDMGPMAGTNGGEVVFQGDHDDLINSDESLTAKYLTGKMNIETPKNRRDWKLSIDIRGAREHNLKNIDVSFPLKALTVVTGVSGSGKSTLVRKILFPSIQKKLGEYGDITGEFDELAGDISAIQNIEFVDQNPIGKSSRSNPVTYVKAFDEIRSLFASQQLAKLRGFKPSYFSFNVEGGRCEKCKGEGEITVEMQFMADIHLQCDACKGKRYKSEVLEIEYEGKTIADVLNLTIDEAIEFFGSQEENDAKKVVNKLLPLQDVGLGYIKLGQSSSTLSGGEAQRIKLASFLVKGKTRDKTLFIFDEPTTGLHFHDIEKLLRALNALIDNGHSIIVVEHNAEIIKCADWVIDLGPEGGKNGGDLVFAGTPEDLINHKESYTGQYLKGKL